MAEQLTTVSHRAPKLRPDLLIRCQSETGADVWVVKDPVAERYFRFRAVEGFILGQLDGTIPLDSIRHKVEAEFGATLSATVLEQFVSRLEKLGLLADANAKQQGRYFRGSVLYLRLKAVNPDRLLQWMAGRLSFLFTRSFVSFSALTIVAGFCITIANWTEIQRDLPRLYSLHSLAVAWAIAVVVILFHEFAHGLTCKRFGGSVREMGLLLIFFQPAFYCNVSDAWLFSKKSQRLWVTFAGAYFEMFLWAVATLVWRVTDPNTLINYLALVVVATSAVKSLFNLNPLIKLDGYYLLSDWLEIPNLRQRAFAYLGGCVRRLFTWTKTVLAPVTPRERRIFFLYGTLAWLYSFWLLTWVLAQFGGYLVGRYQGWGFVSFLACLALLFQRPLKNVLRAPLRLVTVAPTMRVWVKCLKWTVRLAVVAALVALLFLYHTELKISGQFTILPLRNADVRAAVEGVIQSIEVEENDRVKEGDKIATLHDRDLRSELRKNQAELEATQARLNLLRAGARPEEVELLRTGIDKAEERLKYARTHLDMDLTLVKDKLVSLKELEDTKELVTVREKELQEARDKLKLVLAGSRKEEIDAVQAEFSRLNAVQRYLEEQLELLTIHSPISGLVVTHKLKEKVGRAVKKGDLIAEVHEMNTVTAEVAIPEKEIGDVKAGQKVTLKVRAYPERTFTGTVSTIAPVATAPEDLRADRTILITTKLDNADQLLKPEMTGHAKIHIGDRRLLDIVSRRAVRYVKVEFWSWW
jgi:putative peptide zinc metalloprotease protein